MVVNAINNDSSVKPTKSVDMMLNADEIFSNFTVSQIQALNQDYLRNVKVAKEELHNLVGHKYRDLIRISENIKQMNDQASAMSQELSDLSFNKSNFVDFRDNQLAVFKRKTKEQLLASFYDRSKEETLKNIVNEKLLSFVLTLDSDKERKSKFYDELVYHSRLFLFLEHNYSDVLNSNKHLSSRFEKLKKRLQVKLQHEIAPYNFHCYLSGISYSYLYSDGKMDTNFFESGAANHRDLFSDDWYELSLYESEIENESSMPIDFSYDNGLPPFLSLFISYYFLLLSSDSEILINKVIEMVLKLRIGFLENLKMTVKGFKNTDEFMSVNFEILFRYIENTFNYVKFYFEGKDGGESHLKKELIKILDKNTFSEFVPPYDDPKEQQKSHKFDAESVNSVSVEVYGPQFDEMNQIMISIIDHIIGSVPDKESKSEVNLANSLLILQRLLKGIRKTEIFFGNTTKHYRLLAHLITEHDDRKNNLTEILDTLVSNCKEIFSSHFNNLYSNDDAAPSIYKLISNPSNIEMKHNVQHCDLFSNQISDLMDNNTNGYINDMKYFSSIPDFALSLDDVSFKIWSWFNDLKILNQMVSTSEKYDDETADPDNFTGYFVNYISKTKSKLADDSKSKFLNIFLAHFKELSNFSHNGIKSSISSMMEKLQTSAHELMSNKQPLEYAYYVLRALLTLSNRISDISSDKLAFQDTIGSIDEISQKISVYLIHHIPTVDFTGNGSFTVQIVKLYSGQKNAVSEGELVLPSRPSLRLISLVYDLSSRYLSLSGKDSFSRLVYSKLFSNAKSFVEDKNEWILHTLIDNMSELLVPNSDETKAVEHLTFENYDPQNKNMTLQVFADIVFLRLLITEEYAVDENMQSHSSIIEKIREHSDDNFLTDDICHYIIKSVVDFYQSNKKMYIPLSNK
ncbi:Piso0_005072 [Millerozyma farinosa CBS 7064]|uniref:Piso0_005072 protein n=1 Tax=Pichia sorbitophila (strain ATCC MYA-4447 / BCRC 22081 / CBS 7064 / NBRC 10061 / NRRL Y-12695) TaxID=559304 RepID=G8Y172_PICSO|nr:Piso0_005072 [Millerozyma farinosa CBS 7064]